MRLHPGAAPPHRKNVVRLLKKSPSIGRLKPVMSPFAKRSSIRTKLLLAFAILLTAWLAVSISQGITLYFSQQASSAMLRSQAILVGAYDVEKQMLDAETGLRGFIISGEPEFLAPYHSATNGFSSAYHDLLAKLDNRPAEMALLDKARESYRTWQDQVAEPMIAARRDTPVAASKAALDVQDKLVDLELALRPPVVESDVDGVLDDIRTDLHRVVIAAPDENTTTLARRGIQGVDALLKANNVSLATTERLNVIDILDQLTDSVLAGQRRLDAMIANGEGKDEVDAFRDALHKITNREEQELARRAEANQHIKGLSWLGPLLGLILAIVLAQRLSNRARDSLNRINDAAGRLAAGDLDARVISESRDEIGELAERFNTMAELVQKRSREADQLTDMSEMLQGCADTAEAFRLFSRLAQALFPRVSGALYMISPSRDDAVMMASWGDRAPLRSGNFAPEDCWALRLGKIHEADATERVHCEHFVDKARESLCIPLHAYGETLGLLTVVAPPESSGYFQEHTHRRAFKVAIAEHLSLALANLRLRESLRNQSVRDPLTGLFNRRYLEETLHREISRADRHQQPLSVIAFDVDHFKRYNDTYGHEGGDAVLTSLGSLLLHEFRTDDVACRSGGEEFILVLPNANLEQAQQRADALRRRVAEMSVKRDDIALDSVTVSMGVATYPQHGKTGRKLLRAADRALYRAKEEGRNRVIMADGPNGD